MMRVLLLAATILLGAASPSLAQQSSRSNEEPIVVRGLSDGARIVEVDFDKVWKKCAECKRALAKLDKLAQNYRDEREVAAQFSAGSGHCGSTARPSAITTFQQSSAQGVGAGPATGAEIIGGLCAARLEELSRRTYAAPAKRFGAPEQARLNAYVRSFLDQVALQVADATEAERIAHRATAGLTDKKRTRLAARNLQRVDVTRAVIARIDASNFKVVLPDPPPRGPARGGYEPIR
jgi:hypothetical protein